METAWPKTFRVGVTTPGLWRGGGHLVIAPGFIACSPGPLTGALSRAGEVVHDGRHVDLFVVRLLPPWFNVTIPVRGQAGVRVASTWLLAKHNLRRTLRATGFEVTEHVTWVNRGFRWTEMQSKRPDIA